MSNPSPSFKDHHLVSQFISETVAIKKRGTWSSRITPAHNTNGKRNIYRNLYNQPWSSSSWPRENMSRNEHVISYSPKPWKETVQSKSIKLSEYPWSSPKVQISRFQLVVLGVSSIPHHSPSEHPAHLSAVSTDAVARQLRCEDPSTRARRPDAFTSEPYIIGMFTHP